MTEYGEVPKDRERSPIEQQSSTGGTATGWHSTMLTTPGKSIGAFILETIVGAAVLIGLVALFAWLT
jgi:hypothetical protein